MPCHAIVLATKGIIYNPNQIIRNILPLQLKLVKSSHKLNLNKLNTVTLNTQINRQKLNVIKLPNLKLNQKLSSLTLNLKKCEE